MKGDLEPIKEIPSVGDIVYFKSHFGRNALFKAEVKAVDGSMVCSKIVDPKEVKRYYEITGRFVAGRSTFTRNFPYDMFIGYTENDIEFFLPTPYSLRDNVS